MALEKAPVSIRSSIGNTKFIGIENREVPSWLDSTLIEDKGEREGTMCSSPSLFGSGSSVVDCTSVVASSVVEASCCCGIVYCMLKHVDRVRVELRDMSDGTNNYSVYDQIVAIIAMTTT